MVRVLIKLISINVRKNRTKTIQRLLARYAKIKRINVTYHEDGNTRVDHLLSGKSDLTTDVPIERVDDVKNLTKQTFKVHQALERI